MEAPFADPTHGQVVVDLDATLVGAHSEKEGATANFKRGFGFHPMLAFVDHGPGGTAEPLAGMLRPGRANANDAADQIAVLDAALAQLPEQARSRVLVRGDTGSGVQPLLWHVHTLGLQYSVGGYGRQPVLDALGVLPKQAWRAALDADGTARDGAQVAELTRWLPTTFVGWPPGMRIIARRERPHPGAQLRITDHQGWRITLFATNTGGGRLADLEAPGTGCGPAPKTASGAKDTGLTNLPLQAFAKNRIWLELSLAERGSVVVGDDLVHDPFSGLGLAVAVVGGAHVYRVLVLSTPAWMRRGFCVARHGLSPFRRGCGTR